MSTSQIHYESYADVFDQERRLSIDKQRQWLDLFEQHLGLRAAMRVLDIGCGTGRFSILLADYFGCTVVGIDPSLAMLSVAVAKRSAGMDWLRGVGEALPFAEGAFDVCFISQVMQHFENAPQALAEMGRVLQPGGRVGIRQSSHAQLPTILDYHFFPSALQIERDRLPDISAVKEMLLAAGFSRLEEHVVRQRLFESADDYLEKLRSRYASVLFLISDEEYQCGLAEAEKYLRRPIAEDDQYAEITFLVGVK